MIKYFQTTTVILTWCVLLSVAWAFLVFSLRTRRGTYVKPEITGRMALIPSLVLGPIALVLAYKLVGVNLLFPVHFDATFSAVVSSAFVPALVLMTASGLFSVIYRQMGAELHFWHEKPFAVYAQATGRGFAQSVRRLAMGKTLVSAWLLCLPWLFGELIIIESIFNAPGLALEAWHLARTRDFPSLISVIATLAVLYGLFLGMAVFGQRWLGKRLESYQ